MTCEYCGKEMSEEYEGEFYCEECGTRCSVNDDGTVDWAYGEELAYDETYDYDDMPEGCRACGNSAWPECEESCSIIAD